jgi:protein-L-isoaspartate O-methyltransferase
MYGNIKIVSHTDESGERLTYYPNRSYAHSSVYPAAPLTNSSVALDYLTFLTLAPGKRVLVLGTALGAALAMAGEIDPALQITGVEIDPAVIDVSRHYLPQLNAPNISLVAKDARVFLKESDAVYDFVLVDLFAGDFLPPHCVTQEFFGLVRAHLAPEGVMFINSNMPELLALEGVGAIERPTQHLESAIFNAGFPQLLRSDFVVNGHFTAFRTARPLEERREALRGQARRSDLPVEYRAQEALESFSLSEVPPERAALAPFTDDWVPDAMIHRRDNVKGHLEAAAREGEGSWRTLISAQRHASALDIARWRFWEIGHVPGRTFAQFMASPGQLRFCKEVDDWAASSTEPVSEIFRYFSRFDIRNCARVIASLPAAPAESRLSGFRGLLLAAALTQEGKPAQAWPSLAQAIEDQRLTRQRP